MVLRESGDERSRQAVAALLQIRGAEDPSPLRGRLDTRSVSGAVPGDEKDHAEPQPSAG